MELQAVVRRSDGYPVRVVDPSDESVYVLLTDAQYQRVRALVETDTFDISETYGAQDEFAAKAGWERPFSSSAGRLL